MPAKQCVLYDRNCIGCMVCDKCDLDPNKICDSCGKCLEEEKGYRELKIDGIELETN
ncbi:MAG: hypothetical protein IJE44_00520 [Clostridia bacterium]|nr:hypothetical protein [Clostridia bacterium]